MHFLRGIRQHTLLGLDQSDTRDRACRSVTVRSGASRRAGVCADWKVTGRQNHSQAVFRAVLLSMAGSLRFHHSCRHSMHSIISMENGGRPPWLGVLRIPRARYGPPRESTAGPRSPRRARPSRGSSWALGPSAMCIDRCQPCLGCWALCKIRLGRFGRPCLGELHVDILELRELQQLFLGLLPADTRLLVATEWRARNVD